MDKSLTIFDTFKQFENNATKALIDVLRFSEPQLTQLFITHCVGITTLLVGAEQEGYYDVLIGTKLVHCAGNGYVLAITDEARKPMRMQKNSKKERNSVPDAAIQFGNVTLLIESKVKSGSIDVQQLIDHAVTFAEGEVIHPNIYLSWQRIHEFFEDLIRDNDRKWKDVTVFLMKQYVVYCKSMGFIYKKDSSYIYAYFNNHPRLQLLISEVDTYLTNLKYVRRRENIKDCFGYVIQKKDGTKTHKFFTASTIYKGYFILHLLYENVELIQDRANRVFLNNKRLNGKENEVHINMHLVDSFDKIKPFLEIAYDDRMTKHHFGWKA